ncbi:hypothetical protein CR513_28105, partial [Mucuna pruriens]
MDVKTMFLNGDIDETFMIVYITSSINDILFASSDTYLLHDTKIFFTKNLEMKDLGEASFVLGIHILRSLSRYPEVIVRELYQQSLRKI